jgi:predicted Co/Zn/Cd cation transporter (cation efflux family)
MFHLIEAVIGVALISLGLSKFGPADQKRGFFFGIVAVVGLVLAVHGILLFLVPDFFKPSV